MKKTTEINKISISQCMIVKNEEKNIEKALSWGKGIVAEQIVVDTGSTDRTVEIAKQMGAAVYHYEWNNDFAAAKNYTIEKASGTWIAFLDADEYLKEEDAKKLPLLLEETERTGRECGKDYQLLRCQMVNLNDSNKVFSVFRQDRFFINDPGLRYNGAIHETLNRTDGKPMYCCDIGGNLTIYHTGYSQEAYKETKKAERNVTIMMELLEKNPDDYNMMGYLADSLVVADRLEEALEYDRKVVSHREDGVGANRLISSYSRLLREKMLRKDPEDEDEINRLYQDAISVNNNYPDFDYYMGIWHINMKHWEEAANYFTSTISKGDQYRGNDVCFVNGNLPEVCYWTAMSESHLEHTSKTVTYTVLALRQDHYHEKALKLLLETFAKAETEPEEVIGFLDKIYDFNSLKDKLFIIKAAKSSGFYRLGDCLFSMLSDAEQEEMKTGAKRALTRRALTAAPEQRNSIDVLFTLLMEQINGSSKEELLACMKDALSEMKEKQQPDYDRLLVYLNNRKERYGQLSPEEGNYEAFELRSEQLSEHLEEYLWLYKNLKDYRSKKTLLAILSNWLYLNTSLSAEVKENGPEYFDLDLIPGDQGGVFVDIGSGAGAGLYSYIQNYGEEYQTIHCYEEDWERMKHLKEVSRKLERIEYHTENIAYPDGEIKEKVTMIRIAPKDSLLEILEGCVKTMEASSPRLAIGVSSQYEHIWKAAGFIDKQPSEYQLYLRHYGGNLIPVGYILYAIPIHGLLQQGKLPGIGAGSQDASSERNRNNGTKSSFYKYRL